MFLLAPGFLTITCQACIIHTVFKNWIAGKLRLQKLKLADKKSRSIFKGYLQGQLFNYCSEVWDPHQGYSKTKLERVQYFCQTSY